MVVWADYTYTYPPGFKKWPPEKRFEFCVSKEDHPNGCWKWIGVTLPTGYGQIMVDKVKKYAHVYSYELKYGPVPKGLELHHKCETRDCVNPDHLVAVSHRDNLREASTLWVQKNLQKTHCPKGHEYTEANTYYYVNKYGSKGRFCRTCASNKNNPKRPPL